jgi:glutaredoxin 2
VYLYQSFYAKNQRESQQKFEDYFENIDDVAERIKEMLVYLKNLTALKEVLQIRNKRNNLLYADDLLGGFGSKDIDGLF